MAVSLAQAFSRDGFDLSRQEWSLLAVGPGGWLQVTPSPLIALNRAVAVGMARGPVHGLALVEQLADDPAPARCPQLPAARATVLRRLDRLDEALQQFRLAAELSTNVQERRLYLRQADTTRTTSDRSPSS